MIRLFHLASPRIGAGNVGDFASHCSLPLAQEQTALEILDVEDGLVKDHEHAELGNAQGTRVDTNTFGKDMMIWVKTSQLWTSFSHLT